MTFTSDELKMIGGVLNNVIGGFENWDDATVHILLGRNRDELVALRGKVRLLIEDSKSSDQSKSQSDCSDN